MGPLLTAERKLMASRAKKAVQNANGPFASALSAPVVIKQLM